MTRPTRSLLALYAAGAMLAGHCAMTSARNGSIWYTAGLAAVSLLLAVALSREYLHADEQRAPVRQAERSARPTDLITPALRDELALAWQDLEAACCLRSWESLGAIHDSATCTRKDHTA